jgi:hypothetical protein
VIQQTRAPAGTTRLAHAGSTTESMEPAMSEFKSGTPGKADDQKKPVRSTTKDSQPVELGVEELEERIAPMKI